MGSTTHLAVIASTNNQTSYASSSFTPTAGRLITVAFSPGNLVATTGFAVTASANGLTFVEDTRARSQRANVDDVRFFVAQQLTPGSPVAMTVTVAAGGTAQGMIAFIAETDGMVRVGLSAVRGAAGGNQALGVTPSATMGAAALTANPVLTYVWNATSPSGVTQPTSFTSGVVDQGYATPTRGGRYAFRNTGHTSATVSWGSTSASASANIAVELDTSAAPLVLVVDKARASSRAGQPALGQHTALTVDKARALARAAEALLTEVSSLVVDKSRALARSSTPQLTQHSETAVLGARGETRIGSPGVAQRSVLTAYKARAATRAGRPLLKLITPGALTVNGVRAASRAGRPQLVQRSVMQVAGARSESHVGEVDLEQHTELAVDRVRAATRAPDVLVSIVLQLLLNGARAPTRAARVDLGITTPVSRTYVVPHEIRTSVVPHEIRTTRA